MTATGWDAGLTSSDDGAGRRGLPELLEAAPSKPSVLGSWEDWLSFALLAATQLAFALSIARANWVAEMPSLPIAAALGLVAGSALARVRFNALPLFLAGVALGFAVAVGMVMQTMELSNPLGPSGLATRWSEIWARMGDWLDALIFGGVSSDPLPFVMLMVFVAWLLPYIAGWAVFRWQNAWLALVPAGVGILTNISYLPGQPSLEFILFLFAAILLFTRLQLLRTVRRWRGQQTALPQLLSLEVLHAGAWVAVGLVLLAWLIPAGNEFGAASSGWERVIQPLTDRVDRFGQVFIGVDSKRSQLIHHFDDALPLRGRVRLDDEPMFIVALPSDDVVVPHLRSGVFDQYGREGWQLSDTDREPLPGTTIEAASFGTPETREQLRRPIVAEVLVAQPLSDRRLLSVGDPLAADLDAEFLTGAAGADLVGLRPDDRIESGDSYITVGTVSAADVEILIAAGTAYPAWVTERYLQLPDSLPDRVRDLAVEVAGDTDVPYVAAFQIERYLRTNYPFTLRVDDPPPRRDAIDFFLFETRQGYFDHHASAMAVLLRAVGIPARVAVGFSIDDSAFDEDSKTYVLTEQDSWTWPEVYFPGLGWVEFNPTPVRATISRPGPQVFGLTDEDPAANPDEDLLLLDEATAIDDTELIVLDGTEDGTDSGGSASYTVPLLWLLALAAGASALYFVVRAGWAYPYRNLAPATVRWAKVQRLSGWAGLRAEAHRTPLEAAGALQRDLEAEEHVQLLARSFTRERYGGVASAAAPADTDSDPTRLDALYRRVRNRLFRETLLRRLGFRSRSR